MFRIYSNRYKIQNGLQIQNDGHFSENAYEYKTKTIYIVISKS